MRPSRRPRNGLTLVEVLIALSVAALAATLLIGAWTRSEEAAALREAQMQVAAVFRDVLTKTAAMPPGSVGQVVFWPNSNQLMEQLATPGQPWQTGQPPGGLSLWLPGSVTISSYTFPTNAMRVFNGDLSTGTYQAANNASWSGQLTLQTTHGMTGTVHVTRAGTVWY